ncbi:N-acyl amino acid synthase FeeM domain-containing protein [Sphingobium nicotianae]|uniref:Acetyltransferase n=1 Tax=Sphingobium nicotianae TaxID=2782607 RepID=A0A9X1DG80_9SPHN|nr:acetyltransferase [Sphingobium nicotianae]MBT2188898.1 acetyltransferase [Sphingobium nicotianae]
MSLMLQHRQRFAGQVFSEFPRPSGRDSIYFDHVVMPGESVERRLDVRLATCAADRDLARMLINKMYDWRGYGCDHVIPASERHSTFLASLDDQTVGTITLAVDADGGLAADRIFRDEINSFRRVPGARVCELTKLAFDTEMPSRKLMASLFHIVFIYGKRRHRCTDLFIEVNPRHRRFYEAMLGFTPIGGLKENESVGAPAQLMWLKVADIATRISEYAGRAPSANCRSLYPLFLTRSDERSVRARLSRSFSDHFQ